MQPELKEELEKKDVAMKQQVFLLEEKFTKEQTKMEKI